MKTSQQVLMKKKHYREVKKSIAMMNSQRSNIKRKKFTEDRKIIYIDEIIKQGERVNNS